MSVARPGVCASFVAATLVALSLVPRAFQERRVRRRTSGGLCASFVAATLALLSGCGYVVSRVTASPPLPTPVSEATASVWLSTVAPRATATAVPATPVSEATPTATATATATPVVYIVQKGDTILEIADRYDVSAQALIEVNGILNPRALSIGQPLIIPLGQEALQRAQPTATPTPMPLRIVHLAFHDTPAGSVWCMGEVQNERDEDLELVQIQVSLHNAGGEALDVGTSFVATDVVRGHGVAPFAVLLLHPPAGGFASFQIVVLSAEPLAHWGPRHPALVVEGVTGAMEGHAFVVRGSVYNQGQVGAQDVEVVVTAYGQDGSVVGIRRAGVVPALAAGQRQGFELPLIPAAPAVRASAAACGMREAP